MVDDAVRHLEEVRERHVWQPIPEEVRARFRTPLPTGPQPLGAVYEELRTNMLPYAMGNIHPRFWGWYMGSGNFTGALGDFLAAIDGSNLGGGSTAAAMIDMQVIDWFKEMMEFPSTASGTLTSGGLDGQSAWRTPSPATRWRALTCGPRASWASPGPCASTPRTRSTVATRRPSRRWASGRGRCTWSRRTTASAST
jgi:hypothetical protein